MTAKQGSINQPSSLNDSNEAKKWDASCVKAIIRQFVSKQPKTKKQKFRSSLDYAWNFVRKSISELCYVHAQTKRLRWKTWNSIRPQQVNKKCTLWVDTHQFEMTGEKGQAKLPVISWKCRRLVIAHKTVSVWSNWQTWDYRRDREARGPRRQLEYQNIANIWNEKKNARRELKVNDDL